MHGENAAGVHVGHCECLLCGPGAKTLKVFTALVSKHAQTVLINSYSSMSRSNTFLQLISSKVLYSLIFSED